MRIEIAIVSKSAGVVEKIICLAKETFFEFVVTDVHVVMAMWLTIDSECGLVFWG